MSNKLISKILLFVGLILIIYLVIYTSQEKTPKYEKTIEIKPTPSDPVADSLMEVKRIQDELEAEAIRKEKVRLLNKYKGTYKIMVNGDGSESYTLMDNGTCIWEFRGGKKQGLWTAKEDYLYITIKGNTGDFVYEYYFRKGRFVDNENPKSYLKRIK